jgi:hypothetical protein
MNHEEIIRKNLDIQRFYELRQITEKIAHFLNRRITGHADVLRPLFIPRKLFGTYIKSTVAEEVPKADKAFAGLQEGYAAICEKPFGLAKKLYPPLPPVSNYLDIVPYRYPLRCEGPEGRTISITSPTRWILSYRSDCSLDRLKAMVEGTETRQIDVMSQTIITHLALVIFMKYFPALGQLLEDLRYELEIRQLADLGNLPVVVAKAPVETFLPPDDFIIKVTQISGIDAFQEIIDLEAVENVTDSLKDDLRNLIG